VAEVKLTTESKVTEVYGDDWIALYIDGKLVEQGHSISAVQLLHALNVEVNPIMMSDESQEDGYECPSNFDDIKDGVLVT